MNKLTLLLLLGTISQSDAILLNKKEIVAAKTVVTNSSQSKDWNILADVVNEKEYMKTQMSALEEQDMHNTDKYTMSAPEFFKKMEKEMPAPKVEKISLAVVNTTSNASTNATANITKNVTMNTTVASNKTVNATSFMSLVQANATANLTKNISSNSTQNVTSNTTSNATMKVFAEVNSVIAVNMTSNDTANVSANVTVQNNSTMNSTSNATVAVVTPVNQLAGAKLTLEQEKQVKIGQILQSHNAQKEQERMIADIDDQYERKKKDQQDYEQTKEATSPNLSQVDLEAQADKITSEALIEKSVRDQEQKKTDDKIKGLSKLDADSLSRIDSLNLAVDTFSKSLSEEDFHAAIKLQKELKSQSLAQGEARLMVHTTDIFEAGFIKFPQISKNEFVQDQINYLDAAQDNLNNNQDNQSLLENFIARAKEVSKNLQTEYPEQWESPLKV